jgi:hypothetical protein
MDTYNTIIYQYKLNFYPLKTICQTNRNKMARGDQACVQNELPINQIEHNKFFQF